MNNIINIIMLIIVSIFMGIITEPIVPIVFIVAVMVYAMAMGIINMVQDKRAATVRMEQVMFTRYLDEHINSGRTALPYSTWFDAYR